MARIPEDVVQKILDATDIVDLIGGHVQLKTAGATFKGLCPFHNEKTPSFNVNPAHQRYKCFGCGEGGDAIGWVMNYENRPFADAVRKLADRANIIIREEIEDPAADKERRQRSRLVELNNKTARFLHELALTHPDAQHARDYLKSRGFDREMAARWLIGWMPHSDKIYFDWAKQEGYRGRELVAAGIAGLKDENDPRRGIYLRMKDRLMFPIHNDYGDVLGFSGRQLRDDPRSGKYVNSPETNLFKKSKIIFGLNKARKPMASAKYALLCEGQIDVIACHEAGLDHAVAGLGTAFTSDHARLLHRFTKNVVLCYDADAAGIKASSRAFKELAAAGISVRYAQMPAGEDPDTYIKQFGADAFRQLIDQAPDFFDAVISTAGTSGTLANPTEKTAFVHDLADLLKAISDPAMQSTLIQHVATRLQIGNEELRHTISSIKTFKERKDPNAEEKRVIEPTPLDRAIATLIQYTLHSRDVYEWLGEQGETLLMASDLPGTALLRRLLVRDISNASPAAINTLLTTLDEADQLAIEPLLGTELPEDPLTAATMTLSQVSDAAYQRHFHGLISKMNDPSLSNESRYSMMKEITDLKELLEMK